MFQHNYNSIIKHSKMFTILSGNMSLKICGDSVESFVVISSRNSVICAKQGLD